MTNQEWTAFETVIEKSRRSYARFGWPDGYRMKAINFLGVAFDGKTVSIRMKTLGRYSYQMHSKAKTIRKSGNYSPEGKHISNKNLYALYSIKGAKGCQITQENGRKRGNTGNFYHMSSGRSKNLDHMDPWKGYQKTTWRKKSAEGERGT